MHRYITRQPILDRYESVYGYALLLRPGQEETWPPIGCCPQVTAEANDARGDELDQITDGTRAFIPCSREILLGPQVAVLPPDRVVLEVGATQGKDEAVVQACVELKKVGYQIALQGFETVGEEPLLEVANIIELDVTASSDRAQWLLIRKYRPRGAVFLATHIDKRPQFQAAVQQGYAYFRGQFYRRPEPYSNGGVTPTKLVYLLVLGAVTRPDINVEEVADTIKHDLALSYRLLRFLNSARFAFHSRIKSIRHALLLLGQNEIRKWIGLISVEALGEGGPPILVSMALIRAAFCEYLAPLMGAAKRQPDYFFLGLLSFIDVLMRRPMRVMLAELPIAPDVSSALMGEPSPMYDVLQAVISYEQGDWEQTSLLAAKLNIKEEKLCELYMQALLWSRELTNEAKNQDSTAKEEPEKPEKLPADTVHHDGA